MKTRAQKLTDRLTKYHFELKHLLVLFIILLVFQLVLSYINQISMNSFLTRTQDWYQQDAAEKLANLTTMSLELILGRGDFDTPEIPKQKEKIIKSIQLLLGQSFLQEHVRDLCILVQKNENTAAIDDGRILYQYITDHVVPEDASNLDHLDALTHFQALHEQVLENEQIQSVLDSLQAFHVFVPFVPKGEVMGVVYMKIVPDFSFITEEMERSYIKTNLVFTLMILIGFLVILYISTTTINERDKTHRVLMDEREIQIRKDMHQAKEALFTKRIYHTHHKAEKVMGFIQEDLMSATSHTFEKIRDRVIKYAGFVSRVIYDMKSYDPPVQTIRGPAFNTDLNKVISYLVEHLFTRVSIQTDRTQFHLNLDRNLPIVHVNEYVIWEILEPLIQNSIDHAGANPVKIQIQTNYDPQSGLIKVTLSDTGPGIQSDLLQEDEQGVKRLFHEYASTKEAVTGSGYGCYIAYQIAKTRCGWTLDAENLDHRGCRFTITIPGDPREKRV
ncbi:ATP-binding protein [candidate division KSB1 bacterium]|nr:ATP-binding protein [candidate division KSB1 bacterium]